MKCGVYIYIHICEGVDREAWSPWMPGASRSTLRPSVGTKGLLYVELELRMRGDDAPRGIHVQVKREEFEGCIRLVPRSRTNRTSSREMNRERAGIGVFLFFLFFSFSCGSPESGSKEMPRYRLGESAAGTTFLLACARTIPAARRSASQEERNQTRR